MASQTGCVQSASARYQRIAFVPLTQLDTAVF